RVLPRCGTTRALPAPPLPRCPPNPKVQYQLEPYGHRTVSPPSEGRVATSGAVWVFPAPLVCLSVGCLDAFRSIPAPSFSGLGLRPFTAATRVRIPLGSRSGG